jgi:hypothetical protein
MLSNQTLQTFYQLISQLKEFVLSYLPAPSISIFNKDSIEVAWNEEETISYVFVIKNNTFSFTYCNQEDMVIIDNITILTPEIVKLLSNFSVRKYSKGL